MRLFAHVLLALCLLLGSFAPPAQAKDDEVPYAALAPLALTAGYIYAGRWDRAIIAPIAVTTLTAGGALAGYMLASNNEGWKDPVGSCLGFVVLPVMGGAVAFGVGTTIVLIDQAALAGPVAPASSAGALLGILGLQAWQPI